jgi:hypothetical protein
MRDGRDGRRRWSWHVRGQDVRGSELTPKSISIISFRFSGLSTFRDPMSSSVAIVGQDKGFGVYLVCLAAFSHLFPPARALPCEFISSTGAGSAGPLLPISSVLNPKKAHRLTIHGLCPDSGPSRSRSLWSWWTATSVLCKTISNAVDLGVFKGLVHLPWPALWGLNSLGFAICPISPFAFFLFRTIARP